MSSREVDEKILEELVVNIGYRRASIQESLFQRQSRDVINRLGIGEQVVVVTQVILGIMDCCIYMG